MKKLLSVSAMALVLLAGCGSTGPVEYQGQSTPIAEGDHAGEYTTVTFTKDGDDITNTKFDVVLADGSSKYELSTSGGYGMKEATGKGWYEHVDSLDAYVDENDAMPPLTEVEKDGETELKDVDGVSGATIGMDGFDEAFNAAAEVEA